MNQIVIKSSRECGSESIDCDPIHDNERIMISVLDIGLIFEYLSTICIVALLSSSIALRDFKGLPPDILDRVLMQSFNYRSLSLCRLTKLASSISSSALVPSTSPITETLSVSELEAGDVIVTKVPDNPLTVADLKTGYLTMMKCKCCFDINTVRIVKTNLISDDDNSDPLLAGLILNHVVEISLPSESDRNIHLNHLATETVNDKYTIYPLFCDGCEGSKCGNCCLVVTCEECNIQYCIDCRIQYCDSCAVIKCRDCDQFNYCHKCERVICDICDENENIVIDFGRSGYCEMCNSFYCSKCDSVSFCDICDGSYCSSCLQIQFCDVCGVSKCVNCEKMIHCSICFSSACMNCSLMHCCDKCEEIGCKTCINTCLKCNKISCKDCSKIMKFNTITSTCASCC